MKQLSTYILENFKISHKTKTQAYHAIQPKNCDGICLYIAVAHYKKHIECSTIKYSYDKNNPETIQCKHIGVMGGLSVEKQNNGYYAKKDDYWDYILLFDSDAIIFLQDYIKNKNNKFNARIFLPTTEPPQYVKHVVTSSEVLKEYTDSEINKMIKQIQTQNVEVN